MAVNLLWLGAAGLGSIVLSVAHRQDLFRKHGIDVRLVPVPGTRIPQLSTEYPFGYIGAPAALMRAAEGVDLRILASLDTARLSGCLVVRPEIVRPEQLRGRRLGARVTGAALWIHTVLAIERLGLHPDRDEIAIAEIGDPAEIAKALEAGDIDGAVLPHAKSEELAAKGFKILLDLYPLEIFGAPDALVVTGRFLRERPETVEGVVAALNEGIAFALSPRERPTVLVSIKSGLNITDSTAAESGLDELSRVVARKPYPSVERLSDMRRIMLMSRPAVRDLVLNQIVEDCFVRKLDEEGFIDRACASYGVS